MSKELDYSKLLQPVGRPAEDVLERIDLKPYLVEKQFERRFKKFYSGWEAIITSKAKRIDKRKYISNMEAFYGEVLEKFNNLSEDNQKVVLRALYPIRILYSLTNLSIPNVFEDYKDNAYFYEELLKTEL